MKIDISEIKLAKTPFWAIDLSNILNRHLKKDDRIPSGFVEFFVCESDEGKLIISVERRELTLDDERYKEYYDVACDIFSSIKEDAIKELESL